MEHNKNFQSAPRPPWLTVVGIGDDGWSGLSDDARAALQKAELVIGSDRQLSLIPSGLGQTRTWHGSIRETVSMLQHEASRRVCVLASGDPLLYGVGSLIARRFGLDDVHFIPHISAFALACARLGWPQPETELVTICGRPVDNLRRYLFEGARVVVLSADEATPIAVGTLLSKCGFGQSIVHVFEHLGGEREQLRTYRAESLSQNSNFAALNTIGVECLAGPGAALLSTGSGLPDEAFEHDGQITKQEVRAITLARLMPRPGELLWDVGAGSGSIAIEWMRVAPRGHAIAVECSHKRASRVHANAKSLGVPSLQVVKGKAPNALTGLPKPDAVFIGGGLKSAGVLDECWQSLRPGGRLVANAVTLESEALLLDARLRLGGTLTRISIDRANPVGRMTGWRPAMPVTQWFVTKASGTQFGVGDLDDERS